MNESPEQQRQRVEREAALKAEVKKLSQTAWEQKLISSYGDAPPTEEQLWQIQRNGKDECFTLEEAKSKLEEIIENGIA